MARALPEVDRLIEEGLTLYGKGDLDGALTSWEAALELEPKHERASSYIDYVRMNYELLMSEVSGHGEAPAFAIADDAADYHVEIVPGELSPANAVPRTDKMLDEEGWAIEEEHRYAPSPPDELTFEMDADEPEEPAETAPTATKVVAGKPPVDLGTLELELEADEPPGAELELAPDDTTVAFARSKGAPVEVGRTDSGGVSFDDATREYPGGAQRPPLELVASEHSALLDFRSNQLTPAPFDGEATPGFNSQATDVRKRDLGFVQAVGEGNPSRHTSQGLGVPSAAASAGAAAASAASPPAPGSSEDRHRRATSSAPDLLKMTLRTPETKDPKDSRESKDSRDSKESRDSRELKEPKEMKAPKAIAVADLASFEADADPPTIERQPITASDAETDALLASLSGKSAVPTKLGVEAQAKQAATRDLPGATRRPASAGEGQVVPFGGRPPSRRPSADPANRGETRDFDVPTERRQLPRVPGLAEQAATALEARDFSDLLPPRTPPGAAPAGKPQPSIVSAPTRDLGLRAQARPPTNNDDEPTGQTELRVLHRSATSPEGRESTRSDVVLPFDPIDARSAQILDDVDERAPAGESREDRTRRRITTLFERASAWNEAGELDRAVTAVDLALSEDPNSVLAQKLIHRNRDTMDAVFRGFLGDLQRTPILARPLHELASAPISPRAAFLLSRVDGLLSLEEILDVSGMPRLEAYRYLCQLFLRGILR